MEVLDLKNIKQIIIINELPLNHALHEKDYFALMDNNKDIKNYYLIGNNTIRPYLASINNEKFILSFNKENLFLVGNVSKFGISLVHYLLDMETGNLCLTDDIPIRKLTLKEDDFMSIQIQQEPNKESALLNSRLQSLNFNNPNAYTQGMPNPNSGAIPNSNMFNPYSPNSNLGDTSIIEQNNQTGISALTHQQLSKIPTLALLRGYLLGYIVKQAPEIYMKLVKTKEKSGSERYDVRAVQSKPSKILKVLLAIPASIATSEGTLARPSDIRKGDIDFDENNHDVYKIAVSEEIAVAYINALGEKLPEYAPTHVEGQKEHWTAMDIAKNNPNITYVRIRSKIVKRRGSEAKETSFVLMPDSRRRSLLTKNNYFPLKIPEHTDISQIKTEQDSYEINKMAFLSWTKKSANKSNTALESAYINCPSIIFKRNYQIDTGEVLTDDQGNTTKKLSTIEGTCCIYFLPENAKIEREDIGSDGKKITSICTKKDITFIPWYSLSKKDSKPQPEPLTQLVTKTQQTTKSGSLQVRKIYHELKDSNIKVDKDPYFKPYLSFYKEVLNYIEEEELKRLTGSSKTNKELSANDRIFLNNLSLQVSEGEELKNIVRQMQFKSVADSQAV